MKSRAPFKRAFTKNFFYKIFCFPESQMVESFSLSHSLSICSSCVSHSHSYSSRYGNALAWMLARPLFGCCGLVVLYYIQLLLLFFFRFELRYAMIVCWPVNSSKYVILYCTVVYDIHSRLYKRRRPGNKRMELVFVRSLTYDACMYVFVCVCV